MGQPKTWISGAVRLRWKVSRGGYEIRDARPSTQEWRKAWAGSLLEEADHPGPEVCARGDVFETIDIALGNKEVLTDLMSMPETHEGVFAFAKSWGLLTPGRSAPLNEFYSAKRELCRAQKIGKDVGFEQLARLFKAPAGKLGDPAEPLLGRAEIRVVRSRGVRPEIHWYVQSLRVFLWLELCLDVGGAAKLAQCRRCKRWYAKKPKGPEPEHCSNACRQAAWREAHRDEANRKRRGKRAKQRRKAA